MKVLKILLKNTKGQQLIEVLIAVFLAGFFISGLDNFYQFTGDFQKVKDFTYAERHFTFIQNLFSQNCDSFIGDKLLYSSYENHNPINGQDSSIPQITMKDSDPPFDHQLLYATSDITEHTLSDHSYIGIKSLNLEKVSAEYALFEVTFESLKTFEEYKKTMKIYINLDSHNRITQCSLKPILPCAEKDIEINYVWEEREGSNSKKYKCFSDKKKETSKAQVRKLKSGWLGGIPALPGETINITDTSSPCCICMIQLQCSEGFWSRSSDCFKRKGECNTCPPGHKWDTVSSSCAIKLPSCSGGKILLLPSKKCKCPQGTTWDGLNCVTCTGGQIWDSVSEKCKCPPAKPYWTGTQCIQCHGGQLWNPSSKTCVCPTGDIWDGSSCVTPPPPTPPSPPPSSG